MARIHLVHRVAAPAARCFDLALSIDAHVLSTEATRERAVGGRTSGLLSFGDEVTWEARHFGVVQRLTTKITAFDRPRYFRDSQTRGIFARFDHDHFFRQLEDGSTEIEDVFDFDAPLGLLGRVAEKIAVERYLRKFLESRNQALKALAEGSSWKKYLP